jgi:hypothetical protein
VTCDDVDVVRGAEALWGDTCPDVLIPPAGYCDETYLIFANDARAAGGGPVPRHSSPWWVYVETNRLAFDGIHGDVGSWTKVRAGYVEFPEAALEVDAVHLASASLDVSIPMGDGTVYDFQGTRHATGDRQRFGNEGPDNERLPGHYNDQCVTTNNHPHQVFRWAEMAGTPNGHRMHSYPWANGLATIFDGHHSFQYVEHEGRSPLHETALPRPRIPSRADDPSRALIGHDRADRRHQRTLPRSRFARAGWTRFAPCEVGAEGSPRDLPG